MTTTELPFDALGQEIKIGEVYGYTATSSGRAKTTIGRAVKFSKTGKITLEVIHVKNFLYGQPSEGSWYQPADTVSMRGHMLFPVDLTKFVTEPPVDWNLPIEGTDGRRALVVGPVFYDEDVTVMFENNPNKFIYHVDGKPVDRFMPRMRNVK